MSSHYVYVIVNKINLKLQFGSHSWEGEGLDPNYYGSGKIIKQAVKKYGKDNFIVYPIKFYDNVDECRRAEEELLTKYDIANNPYCYNLKNSAMGGDKGRKLSEEHRKKLSQAHKGEKHPLYGKRGKDSPNYGKHHTDETRKKIAQANKGLKRSENTKRKISQARKGKRGKDTPNYGKRRTAEIRKKMSQAQNDKKIPVVAIQIDTGKVKIFESQMECSRVLGIHRGNINKCLKGRLKSTGGYTFKYIEQLESGIYEGITGITE